MNTEQNGDVGTLDPIQGVLEILQRASMTSTNKLGLLLVLLDLAPEERVIKKRRLATRLLELHWEHGRPYGNNKIFLRQSSVRKRRSDDSESTDTTIMQEIENLRNLLKDNHKGPLQNKAYRVVSQELKGVNWIGVWEVALERSLRRIEKNMWRNPVSRLQTLPGDPKPFLFTKNGDKIKFLPNVAQGLTRFAGVLRPLIEFQFARSVENINREDLNSLSHDIQTHLFGTVRIMPPYAIRNSMARIQNDKCPYTGADLEMKKRSLDHVIPWSRTRLSVIENFVMTTRSNNSKKKDSLLGPRLLRKWKGHLEKNYRELCKLAESKKWPTDIERVRKVALAIYQSVDPSTGVWDDGDGIIPLTKSGKKEILSFLRNPFRSN